MKNYVSPSVEVILFEDNILAANTSQQVCNCSAVQYKDNHSLTEQCEATTFGYIEIGNNY